MAVPRRGQRLALSPRRHRPHDVGDVDPEAGEGSHEAGVAEDEHPAVGAHHVAAGGLGRRGGADGALGVTGAEDGGALLAPTPSWPCRPAASR